MPPKTQRPKKKSKPQKPPKVEVKREANEQEISRIQKYIDSGGCPDWTSEDLEFFRSIEGESGVTAITQTIKKDLPFDIAITDYKARLAEATGLKDSTLSSEKLLNAAMLLTGGKSDKALIESKMNHLVRNLKEYAPKDAIESSLCLQAIAFEEKAMEMLRLADKQDMADFLKMYSNLAIKLFSKHQQAIQALISYRRGGQQKVTVEHVNVAPGAQAIVGNVTPSKNG